MDIILFGMQGSGKGTQGKILAEKYGLKIFEMGGVLRSLIASATELGNQIKETVESGKLVSDDIIMQVVEVFLETEAKGKNILFDGIPRTMNQAERLLTLLSGHGREVFVVNINISQEEAITRLTKRRMCVQCKEIYPAFYEGTTCSKCGGQLVTRNDDSNLLSIQERLHHFEDETMPVIKHFYNRDRLIEVDGEQPIQKVTDEMIEKAGYLFS